MKNLLIKVLTIILFLSLIAIFVGYRTGYFDSQENSLLDENLDELPDFKPSSPEGTYGYYRELYGKAPELSPGEGYYFDSLAWEVKGMMMHSSKSMIVINPSDFWKKSKAPDILDKKVSKKSKSSK